MCLGFFPSTTQWTRLCSLGRQSGDSGDDDKIMMMTIDDFRSVLEYNVATMCPNQTCEPVEFLQVRICLQVNLVPKIYFPPGGWPEGGFPHQERERWSKSGKHWCCWGGWVSLIVCHCVLHGR